MTLPYRYQWGITLALMIISAMLAVVIITDPMQLGLTAVQKNWAIVIQAGISQALAFFPRITATPNPQRSGLD